MVSSPSCGSHQAILSRGPSQREGCARAPLDLTGDALSGLLEMMSDSATVLAVRSASLRRGGVPILDDVDFVVEEGERWALLGPNGAGKSSLLSLCGALVHPSGGTVDVLGRRMGRVDIRELRESIGHVDPRHSVRSPLTAREVVYTGVTGTKELMQRFEPGAAQRKRTEELLALLDLGRKADSLWPTLSQGERGKTLIARALLPDPALLLLDEPSTGLDVAAREQLLETVDDVHLAHPRLASVLVTHHLEELPVSTTHAALLAHGRIVASGPAETVLTSERISACFEHPIEISRADGRWAARALPRSERMVTDGAR